MHKNNNQTVIKRLTKRFIHTNRTRNIFAVLAIILTTYMISTVFSIGFSFAENYSIMATRSAGTTASIFLDNPTEEQYHKIKQLEYLKSAGIQVNAGSILQHTEDNTDITIPMNYYDESEWKNLYKPAISNINGNYPVKINEIMLSVEALIQLGITNPKLDMEIPLSYISENGEVSESFRLSGWFTNYRDFGSGGIGIALVSQEYLKNSGISLEKSGVLSISTRSGSQQEAYSKLKKDLALKPGQEFHTNFDTSEESSEAAATFIVVGSISLFIVSSGYLLIYNIIYISVAKDIRFYGMLKTIGASPKQIKKIVRNQIYRLSFFAIPLGLVLSLATSFGIVPMAMKIVQNDSTYSAMPSDVSFHPIIFIGTILFAFFTIFLSCRKPAKVAGNVSPMEALRYTDVSSKKREKNRNSTKGGKLHRMAFYNVFREKKRAFLVFASLTTGILTILSVNSFLGSLKAENYIDTYFPDDFEYQSMEPDKQVFDNRFLTKLSQIDGIAKKEIVTTFRSGLVYDETLLTPMLKGIYYDNPYFKVKEQFATYQDFLSHVKSIKDYGTRLITIDDSYVEAYNKTHKEPIDIEAFRNGEAVIISNSMSYKNMKNMIGKAIVLKEKNINKETTVTIGGIFNGDESKYDLYGHQSGEISAIYVSETFMNHFTDEAQVLLINMNVDHSKESEINAQFKELNTQLSSGNYEFKSKPDVTAYFKSTIKIMNVLANSISILLIFIGILNFVNVMITGVYGRRKELAMLESVGMTKKQIHYMLTFEGLYYALITMIVMLTLGNGVIYGISILIPKIADYATLDYPGMLISVLTSIIFLICLVVPNVIYKITVKESVTERLREAEN